MNITMKWLETYPHDACDDGLKWLLAMRPDFRSMKVRNLLDLCLDNNHFDYANWLIMALLDDEQKKFYRLHADELAEHIYNERYPNDQCVHNCNAATKRYLENPTIDNLILFHKARTTAWNEEFKAARAAVEADSSITRDIIDYGYQLYIGGVE